MKIALIDTDENFRKQLVDVLEQNFECSIVQLKNLIEAKGFISSRDDIDLIISDFMFENDNGCGIYQLVKEKKNPYPFVWVTHKELSGIIKSDSLNSFSTDHQLNNHILKHMALDLIEEYIDHNFPNAKRKVYEVLKKDISIPKKTTEADDACLDNKIEILATETVKPNLKNKKRTAKILIGLNGDPEFKDLLIMYIEADFNAHFTFASNINELITALNEKKDFDLILSSYKLKEGTVGPLNKALGLLPKKIPFLLLTESYPAKDPDFAGFLTSGKNSYLKIPFRQNNLSSTLSFMVNLEQRSIKEGFKRVKSKYLDKILDKNLTLYSINDKNEYIENFLDANEKKKLHSGTEKGDAFFVKIEDYENFSDDECKNYKEKLSDSKISDAQKMDIQFESIEHIHDVLQDLGLSRREIELGENNVSASIDILQKNSKMSGLLGKLIKNKNYTYELAMLTSYLSSAMALRINWASVSTMRKLSFASIFQDLSLDNPEFAKVLSAEDPKLNRFSEEEKKIILNHPIKSVELLNEVKEIEEISSDIKNVILQHHERPNNKGLLGVHHTQITPLSCILIIAHEFSHRITVEKISREILQKILIDFAKMFDVGHFRKPYEAFIKTFKQ